MPDDVEQPIDYCGIVVMDDEADDVELTEPTMVEKVWQRLVDTTAPARRSGYLTGLDHMALITREELEAALDEAARTPVSVEEAATMLRSLLDGEFTLLTIGFNDLHACNYQTAKQWSESMGEPDGGLQTYNDLADWVSPEEREKALANNSVWSIQWYPNTPVGFNDLYASSLPALIAAIAALSTRP
jgi:hypothetical protein